MKAPKPIFIEMASNALDEAMGNSGIDFDPEEYQDILKRMARSLEEDVNEYINDNLQDLKGWY